MNNYSHFTPDWRVFISLRENQGVPIEKLRQQFLQEMNNYYGRELFLMNMAAAAGSGTVSTTPSITPLTPLTSEFAGSIYSRLDGQSNAAAQFSVASETGSIDFTEVSQSTSDVSYIPGGQPAGNGYDEPFGSNITAVLNQTLADGNGITLNGSNDVSWYSSQDFSIMAKLNQLMLDNINGIDRIYSHIGAKGGTSVGDHIADNTYNPQKAGSVDKGGYLRVKQRSWEWWYQRYGPNGGNASLEGTDPANYKVFIYWQGENEFLRVARNQSTLEYANNARDALHAKFESLGFYDYYDAIVEVQPVYFAGYSDTTDKPTWETAYSDIVTSYKSKAEAKDKTIWIDINDMLQAPTSASYKLAAAVPGGSVFNKYLHMNPAAHYEIANRIWNKIYQP